MTNEQQKAKELAKLLTAFADGKQLQFFNDNDNICIVDINMGCPAPKIVKNGEGSALMKKPELAAKIVKEKN